MLRPPKRKRPSFAAAFAMGMIFLFVLEVVVGMLLWFVHSVR